MPVFDQLCHVATRAQEKNLISKPLAERICAIGRDRLHYKHLGLELHRLLADLTPINGKSPGVVPAGLEEMVQRIEDKHRRI